MRPFAGVHPELEVRSASFGLAPAGFIVRRRERCVDCDLREALAADGHVLFARGRKLSGGCVHCEGNGELPAIPRRDLYAEAA